MKKDVKGIVKLMNILIYNIVLVKNIGRFKDIKIKKIKAYDD